MIAIAIVAVGFFLVAVLCVGFHDTMRALGRIAEALEEANRQDRLPMRCGEENP